MTDIEAEAAEVADLARYRQAIEAMHNILRVLNSDRALDDILAHIIAQPGHLLGCTAAAIYCLDADGRFYVQASEGMDASLTQFHDSVNHSFRQQFKASHEPLVVTDSADLLDTAWARRDSEHLAYVQNLIRHYRAYVAAPIIVGEVMRGALMVYYPHPRQFSPDELSLVTAFRDQAALALENAALHDQARQHAIADERNRIARDLHDSVTQALYGITLCTEASMRHLASGDTAAAAAGLNQMQGLARDALGEMRALIYQLHSPLLAGRDLAEALRERAGLIEAGSAMRIELDIAEGVRLAGPLAEALYRIIQEGLNNILKHSRASLVVLSLTHAERCLRLVLRDDGCGFDPARTTRGFGLRHMAERAEALGGHFTVESSPGAGTALCVELPLP